MVHSLWSKSSSSLQLGFTGTKVLISVYDLIFMSTVRLTNKSKYELISEHQF